jgi:hypothetical protein
LGLSVLQGVLWLVRGLGRLPNRLEREVLHRIALSYRYRPRPDDIFVVAYPKSGTTLLQMMLYQITTNGDMDFPHIASVSPWFEEFLCYGFAAFVDQLPSPRIFKSHLRRDRMPRGARSIYVARNFHDAAVSAFHHYCLVTGCDHPFESFADDLLSGKRFYGSWFKHLESWWPHRDDPDVLFLRYEAIIADLAATVRRVAAFCGVPVEEWSMARIVERCSVGFMRQHDAKFDPRLQQLSRVERTFVRHGRRGEGRGAFTPAQERVISGRLAALARKLGCTQDDPCHELLAPYRGDAAAVAVPVAPGVRNGMGSGAGQGR